MIKLIAFDWNGTLLADTAAVLKAANSVFKSIDGRRISLKVLRETAMVPVSDSYVKLGYDIKMVLEKAQVHANIFHPNYEKLASKVRTRRGVRELLKYLKKKKIQSVIISNHTKKGVEAQLKRLKIEQYFDLFLANEDMAFSIKERMKEKKLSLYMKEKEIKKSEVLIVGDSLEEIEVGRSLGIKSVAIKDGNYSTKRLRKAGPDYLIGNIKSLIPIIETLS